MGLLDYYRRFEDVGEEELNRLRRERRARERALALEHEPELDLSQTESPELPNSEVVNASIFTARGRINGYPDRRADAVRGALGAEHGIEPERIVLGNGAAELIQAAALAVLAAGDELLIPWPSYPLYPLMAARAGGRAVRTGSVGELPGAVTGRTRLLVLCNPNDPTGEYLTAETVASLVAEVPERVLVVVDEALAHFQDAEPLDSVLRLTDRLPNLLVVRSFSKIYGLSGLRAGYAVGSPSSASVLDAITPALGVNALTQAAVRQALEIGGAEVGRRRARVIRERGRLLHALRGLPVEAAHSEANFVWLAAASLSGAELAGRLRRDGVIVAPGEPLGSPAHVRATVRDPAATDRLLGALGRALG